MKKIFTLLALSFMILTANAQQFIVWNGGKGTVQSQPFDSLTFTLPENTFNLTAGDPNLVSANSMRGYMIVESNLNLDVNVASEEGICWSKKNHDPNLGDSKISVGRYKTGTFIFTIPNLDKNTKYYYRPYILLNGKAWYGEVKSFTTLADELPEYVDLGLSVKWATRNIGAKDPEGYGYYYAWGEVTPKDNYEWSTYKWCKGSKNSLTKYCVSDTCGYNGFTDNKTTLDPEDDAATVNLGSPWRMPTQKEIDELVKGCTWTWKEQNGVLGYLVVSKVNGNSIFLPAAGYVYGHRSVYNINGDYWSSSVYTSKSYNAFRLFSYDAEYYLSNNIRYFGFPIRPVRP